MGKLLLGYWNIHGTFWTAQLGQITVVFNNFSSFLLGLASQIRFLLELVGADYEEKYYDEPDKWFKEDKENLG